MYAATTKDEGNAVDGPFSAAYQTFLWVSMIFFLRLPAHPVKTGQARWGCKIIYSLCMSHFNDSSFLG